MSFRCINHGFFLLVFSGVMSYLFLEYIDLNASCASQHMPKMRSKFKLTKFQHWLSQLKTVRLPDVSIVNTVWQAVVEKQTYVLSAFHDIRDEPYGSIRIMAFSSTYQWLLQPRLYCHLWYGQSNISFSYVPATVRIQIDPIREAHNRRYGPEILTCYLPDIRVPEFVSISTSNCQIADNLLHIKKPDEQPTHSFTVCVAPLIHNYSNVYQLTEFIESNRLFGAEHFVFYDYESDPLLYPYLRSYLKEGIMQLVQWPSIPVYVADGEAEPPPDLHSYGQVVALADCVYRHMFDSQFVAYIDLDEMIVPRGGHTWRTLIQKANQQNSLYDRIRLYVPFLPNIQSGAFSFRNRFFLISKQQVSKVDHLRHLNFSDAMSLITNYHIKSLSVTKASSKYYPHGVRSKYIMRPMQVLIPGIHFVFKFYSVNRRMFKFEDDTAMLHHYRYCLPETGADVEADDDFTVLAYLDVLLPRIQSRHKFVRSTFNGMH